MHVSTRASAHTCVRVGAHAPPMHGRRGQHGWGGQDTTSTRPIGLTGIINICEARAGMHMFGLSPFLRLWQFENAHLKKCFPGKDMDPVFYFSNLLRGVRGDGTPFL